MTHSRKFYDGLFQTNLTIRLECIFVSVETVRPFSMLSFLDQRQNVLHRTDRFSKINSSFDLDDFDIYIYASIYPKYFKLFQTTVNSTINITLLSDMLGEFKTKINSLESNQTKQSNHCFFFGENRRQQVVGTHCE